MNRERTTSFGGERERISGGATDKFFLRGHQALLRLIQWYMR
ncbi:hypothetical protein PNH38_00070 [Anoxybacillus rupiensis]|uniref:Uncharacterized protein n=1 Tax=Anoxybacteroides rupiense TaxID=311460 RepID=A0ABT5VYU9_9BACL|nr:hypothetical protein [Anoxybacillus rupiensis]